MRYRATTIQGRGLPTELEVEASSPQDVADQFDKLGRTVIRCVQISPRLRLPQPRSTRRAGGAQREVLLLVEQLRDLLGGGLSVIEALDVLQRGAASRTRHRISDLLARLQSGAALSQAMASQGEFPSLLVALVRTSELTSDLPATLSRFLDHERRLAELRHRLISAGIYPALLMAVGGLVLLFLLLYVMPRFARIFEGMSGELPWSAGVMVLWARTLEANGSWLAVGALSILVAMVLLGTRAELRQGLARALLPRLPGGAHVRTYHLARWHRATGMLVTGGIPFAQALGVAAELLPPSLRDAGTRVERAIQDGLSPSQALTRGGMGTPVAEQLLTAGERTGDMGAVLTRIAQYHEAEISRTLEQVMRLIEPVTMVIIGLCVGLIVVLMYLPIFELASSVQ